MYGIIFQNPGIATDFSKEQHYHRNPVLSWLVLITSLSWLTSDWRQVHCLFRRSSMEVRICSEFADEDYPQITVKYGDQEFHQSFQIDEEQVLDHQRFYFKCVAKYPIEWISYEPALTRHSASRATRTLAAHLHIYRTFSNFFDRNSYRFIITTNLRYKKEAGFKQINGTCRSIVKPFCLSRSIRSLDDVDGVALKIFNEPPQPMADTSGLASGLNPVTPSGSNDEDDHCDYRIYYEEEPSGPRLSFTCETDDGTPTVIKFNHQCSNAMSCLNLYRNSRLPPGCAQPMVHNLTCVRCESRQLRLSQAMIGCESSMEGETHHETSKPFLIFFTSIPDGRSPAKLYFRMEDAEPSEMIRLSKVPSRLYLREQLTVVCNVSNYYFAGGSRLALKFSDSDGLTFLKTTPKNFEIMGQDGGTTIEASFPINSTNLEKVYCFAPVWNSFEWVNQSMIINVKEVISGDIIIAVTITVFITALLVALMFAFLWVKVGKKHGTLNLLTSSEIEEFRRGSVSDENKPIKAMTNFDMAYGTTVTYDQTFEIKRDQLLLDETVVLGHGHFGLVLKGVVKDTESVTRVDVAVKTLKTKVDIGSLKALLSELKILASIGKHENVVNLVAACTKKMGKGEVYVAVEYCAIGNLQNFLRLHRQAFRNQVENDVLVIETPIRKLTASSEFILTIDLVRWAWEASKGMEFLGSKKVIHGDLATRNILLTSDYTIKISDFGLSRQLVDYYYVKKETSMALESLRDMKFSIQSDIWSFGVTLWELFTLAEIPYSGCSWSAEFVEMLAAGHRLGKPKYATSEMYDLMRACWKSDCNNRPSFFAIRMFFDDILTQCTTQDYIQFSPSFRRTITTDEEYTNLPLLQSPRIIIEEEGEDDVFE